MTRSLRALALATVVSLVVAGAVLANPGGAPAVPLNTGQEASVVNGGGNGSFEYTIDGSELCYVLSVHNLSADPVAAHIHLAPRGVAGGVVVPLLTPPDATSSVDECKQIDPGLAAAILADPGAYYVNVHTPMYPAGEVRGQLK